MSDLFRSKYKELSFSIPRIGSPVTPTCRGDIGAERCGAIHPQRQNGRVRRWNPVLAQSCRPVDILWPFERERRRVEDSPIWVWRLQRYDFSADFFSRSEMQRVFRRLRVAWLRLVGC